MKHFFIILSLLLTISVNVEAQNIIIGDKMPEISVKKWLMDSEPSAAEYSCILFYHSKSDLCRQTLATIKQHVKKQKGRLNLTIITKENYHDAGVEMTEHLKEHIGVAFDDGGKTFKYFGVNFIPFCIISHKKRVVWCGNGASLNSATIEKIIKD